MKGLDKHEIIIPLGCSIRQMRRLWLRKKLLAGNGHHSNLALSSIKYHKTALSNLHMEVMIAARMQRDVTRAQCSSRSEWNIKAFVRFPIIWHPSCFSCYPTVWSTSQQTLLRLPSLLQCNIRYYYCCLWAGCLQRPYPLPNPNDVSSGSLEKHCLACCMQSRALFQCLCPKYNDLTIFPSLRKLFVLFNWF